MTRAAGRCCAALLLAAGSVLADPPMTIQLVAEELAIQPGRPFHVGLHLHHAPGHHSYWKFPGVVGVPTKIEWALPPGYVAGDIEWPEPQAVRMGQIGAQGFDRDVLLPIRITPPADLAPGKLVRLEGLASWMSCGERCHPGYARVAVELPVRGDPPAYDARWRPMFEQERARMPGTTEVWQASAVEDAQAVTVRLTPVGPRARRLAGPADAAGVYFFTEDGWIHSDRPQRVQWNGDGSLTISLPRSDVFTGDLPPARLLGVVQNPAGWLADGSLRSLQINPTILR